MSPRGESFLIDRFQRIHGRVVPPLVGIGDDAAIFQLPKGMEAVWTTDSFVENVHFRRHWLTMEEVGYRALAAASSDIAAMGATPAYVLVTLLVPPTLRTHEILRIESGIGEFARANLMRVLGGNLSRSATFAIDTTVVGFVPKRKALFRSGASPGDDLYVTGIPGSAALAVALLRSSKASQVSARALVRTWKHPTPRFKEGVLLRGVASACIDLSDGLLGDAARIAKASGLDFEIDIEALPQSRASTKAAGLLKREFRQFSFLPSDDYELLFTAPHKHRSHVIRYLQNRSRRIGRATKGDGTVWVRDTEGKRRRAGSGAAWDHFKRHPDRQRLSALI